MLLSRKWLSQYIDLSGVSSEEISDILTNLGLEVEGISEKPSLDEKLVVGKILKAEPHPNADSLRVCDVSVGDDLDKLSIVCGAPNAREGILVAVAPVGSVLPGNFKIKKSKIRSIASFGMLCSEKELEISDEHDGILELKEAYKLGHKVNKIIDTSDSVFDVSLTPNRSDCLSYLGIARELGAKLEREVKNPGADYKASSFKSSDVIEVGVEDSSACARLVTLCVKGIKVVPSPFWLVKAMEDSGMRSVNLIVDLTNYVMLEQGQPVHAYDLRALSGSKLSVKVLKEKASFKTLDDKTANLIPDDIVIVNDKDIVGLAGIMGGKASEVQDDTQDIVIEVAEFNPGSVRKTSKRLGLHTEASHRFERGIDVENLPYVAKRLAYLIESSLKELKISSPEIASELCDAYRFPRKEIRVALRLSRAKKILALSLLKVEECIKSLESIGLKILDKTDDRMLFSIPSWRHDLRREVDLIEEVGRLIGFDKIPSELPSMKIEPNEENPFVSFEDDCRFALASLGLSEVMTYPFSSYKDYENLLCSKDDFLWPSAELANALNENERYMQTSLVPALLKSLLQNRNYGDEGAKLFEVGRSYFDLEAFRNVTKKSAFFEQKKSLNYLESDNSKKTLERSLVAGVLDSPLQGKTWRGEAKEPNFYDIKTLLEKFFSALNIKNLEYKVPENGEYPFFHPSASASILCDGKVLGFAGELHPRVSFNYGLSGPSPVLFELDLDKCLKAVSQKIKIAASSKKYPAVSRDLSFLLKSDLSFADFKALVLKSPRKKFFTGVKLFDVYEGEKLGDGSKSFAARFTFQASNKTLSEKEVTKEVDALVNWLKQEVGAEQR